MFFFWQNYSIFFFLLPLQAGRTKLLRYVVSFIFFSHDSWLILLGVIKKIHDTSPGKAVAFTNLGRCGQQQALGVRSLRRRWGIWVSPAATGDMRHGPVGLEYSKPRTLPSLLRTNLANLPLESRSVLETCHNLAAKHYYLWWLLPTYHGFECLNPVATWQPKTWNHQTKNIDRLHLWPTCFWESMYANVAKTRWRNVWFFNPKWSHM